MSVAVDAGTVEPDPRDPDPSRLTPWLDSVLDGGLAGPIVVTPIPGGRSNPTYEVADGERCWVLRRPPHGHVLPTAHDMTREHRVLRALHGSAVPVPRALGLCADPNVIGAPFYVMDKLDGMILRTRDDTAALTEGDRHRFAQQLVRTLAALHGIDPAARGLSDWGRPQGYLRRQLSRWRRQWASSATQPRAEVEELLDRLADALPQNHHVGIVHGDFKADNVMVDRRDPATVLGVLDWEMSTLGDTLTDLGILCSFWDHPDERPNPITAGATALLGFPGRDDLVAEYAALRGIDVTDLDWYLVFADVKVAVILEGIHTRHLHGHTTGDEFAGVGDMVEPLLQRALQRASTSRNPRLRGLKPKGRPRADVYHP